MECIESQTSTFLTVTGGGVEFELEGDPAGDFDPVSGAVRLIGTVRPPFEGHQRVQALSIAPANRPPSRP